MLGMLRSLPQLGRCMNNILQHGMGCSAERMSMLITPQHLAWQRTLDPDNIRRGQLNT